MFLMQTWLASDVCFYQPHDLDKSSSKPDCFGLGIWSQPHMFEMNESCTDSVVFTDEEKFQLRGYVMWKTNANVIAVTLLMN